MIRLNQVEARHNIHMCLVIHLVD